MPGTVEKIIPPVKPGGVEKVEISVEGAEPFYEEIRMNRELLAIHERGARASKGKG